jgi:transposase-like protein
MFYNSEINEYENQYFSTTIDIMSLMHNSHYLNGLFCPHCHSHDVVKNGKSKGRQRYRCKSCRKTFNDLTKTPFAWLHDLEKVPDYIKSMLSGDSLRTAARKSGISLTKSFFLRHKLANSISRLKPSKQSNVHELKEIQINFSNKGSKIVKPHDLNRKVSVIFDTDRNMTLASEVQDSRTRTQNKLLQSIFNRRSKNLALCINKKSFIYNMAKHSIFSIYGVIDEKIYEEFYHCKNVEKLVIKWRKWMKRFHGVASKYLTNYLHWHDFLNNSPDISQYKNILKLIAFKGKAITYKKISMLELRS